MPPPIRRPCDRRDRADYYRDYAPRDDQRRAFEAQLELAGRPGLPVVIHTRAAEDDTFAILREHAEALTAVVLHCFSAPDRVEECVERGYLCSFAGNVTYPKATELQAAARELPTELLLIETDSPYLAPAAARTAERARQRGPHGALPSPSSAASPTRSSSARWSRTPSACSDGVSEPPAARARPACAACARSTSAEPRARPELPDRRQHPRRDRAAAELDAQDVVSRWAAGSGCCPSTSPPASRTCTS